MKRLAIAILWVVSVFLAFGIGHISNSLKHGLFPPDFASDRVVREKIQQAGVTIPESATHLTYGRFGFVEEPAFHIGMEVSSSEREALLISWFAADKDQWEEIAKDDISNYNPSPYYQSQQEFAHYDPASFMNPKGYRFRTESNEYEVVAIFESDGNRLLLYKWWE